MSITGSCGTNRGFRNVLLRKQREGNNTMKLKRYFTGTLKYWPILLILGIVLYSILSERYIDKNFYKEKLNTVIVDKENNLTGGRSYDYVTRSGIIIRVFRPDCLEIEVGDSIVKAENSWTFSVYKKNSLTGFDFYKVYRVHRE